MDSTLACLVRAVRGMVFRAFLLFVASGTPAATWRCSCPCQHGIAQNWSRLAVACAGGFVVMGAGIAACSREVLPIS
jgi:hypothetical protein